MKYIMLTLEVCSFILFFILLNLHNRVPSGFIQRRILVLKVFIQRRILVFLFNTISIAEIKVSLNIWDFLYVTVSHSFYNFSTLTAHANTPPQVSAYISLMPNLSSELWKILEDTAFVSISANWSSDLTNGNRIIFFDLGSV